MRHGSLVLALLGVLVLLGGCAEAERVVTSRERTEFVPRQVRYELAWESALYRPQRVAVSEGCYERSVVGDPVPIECLRVQMLRNETNAFSRNPWVAVPGLVLAIVGLYWFSTRWIDRAPEYSEDELVSRHSRRSVADLVRRVESERQAHVRAISRRRQLAPIVAASVVLGATISGLACVLVGYGSGLWWSFALGMLLFVGVLLIEVLTMTSLLATRADLESFIRRMFFIGGVGLAMVVIGLAGLERRAQLLEFNGVDWPI